MMKIDALVQRIKLQHPLLSENNNWGERGLFYNPKEQFPKGAYALTFKEKDGQNNSSGNFNTGTKYRLNLKISKEKFIALSQSIPKRPVVGGIIESVYNFSALDKMMSHPAYGWMTWICVINPTVKTIESMEAQGLFEKAYQAAVTTIDKKLKQKRSTKQQVHL